MKCGACTKTVPQLNTPVVVERLKDAAVVDGSGNVNETLDSNWTQAGREWVEIKTRGSKEFFRGQQVAENITHQITMRWSKRAGDYTTKMRLRLDGRKLNISEPPRNVDENDEWLVMACTEVPVL